MTDSIRAFVAVEMPASVKDIIRDVEHRLQSHDVARSVRWVDPAQMHITVKFLGDTPLAKVAAVQEALQQVAAHHAPFAMRLAGLGVFPGGQRVRVVWVGLDEGNAELVALIESAELALDRLGFRPEKHDANPHVTLGRVREWARGEQRRQIAELLLATAVPEFPRVEVDHLSLMRSHLSPQGAHYQSIASIPLAGSRS